MKSLVYIESHEGKIEKNSLELITAAKILGEVSAFVGADASVAEEVSSYGVHVDLYEVCESEQDILANIEGLAKEADAVFFPATALGKDLGPRLAARVNSAYISDVVSVELKDGKALYSRPLYGGTVYESFTVQEGLLQVVSVRGGIFAKAERSGTADVSAHEAVKSEETNPLVDTVVELTETVDLEAADVVVAGGRGCGSEEGFAMVEDLAKTLHGVVGASRPAIEAGWISRAHQVGQSGKNVSPKLYIACGISGALQHVSGITNSRCIVAINKDPDASIFDVADIGIVGTCEAVLPLLNEALKQHYGE